jgi:hypothetical protein
MIPTHHLIQVRIVASVIALMLASVSADVLAAAPSQFVLGNAAPAGKSTAYPKDGFCRIELAFSGTSIDRDRARIMLNDTDSGLPIKWSEPSPEAPEDPKWVHAKVDGSDLTLWLPWPEYSGSTRIKIASDDTSSNEVILQLPDFFGLSHVPDLVVVLLALSLAGALFYLPIHLVKRWGVNRVPGTGKGWIVAALFLDKETATYSLSKFQFYLWTVAALIGYIYLALSRSLRQGYFDFHDIPNNLPGIIFISAATTASAQFITVARGPKGAGDQNPSYADFVSTGGVVVAERFQFFVWTILGCLIFLFLMFSVPPNHIKDVPTIPNGFLELMGISSLGYLGGKLARKPGPVIDEITPSIATSQVPTLHLAIKGRILSPDATFKLAYQTLDPKDPTKLNNQQEVDLARESLVVDVIERDDQTKPEITAKKLELTIKNHRPEWLIGKPNLTISNPDGQAATWPFPGSPQIFKINVPSEKQGGALLVLELSGRNLPLDATFKIGDKAITEKQLPLANIQGEMDDVWQPPRFARKLTLSIDGPDSSWITGEHTLTLISPSGLTAEAKFGK